VIEIINSSRRSGSGYESNNDISTPDKVDNSINVNMDNIKEDNIYQEEDEKSKIRKIRFFINLQFLINRKTRFFK
jgi:hypothetical protein